MSIKILSRIEVDRGTSSLIILIMGNILILPDNIKNMIAAGEVVSGPSSVVKELVENSIDAESTELDISIMESGLKKIVVRDNGTGIYRDDIAFAVMEHATSKIKNINDIYSICSYGFRGEALSSIASISKLTLMSRQRTEDTGGKITSYDSTSEISDYCGETGTTVICENLFYNTPARKKFLKTVQGEKRLIKETIFSLALSRPEVVFRYSFDDTPPSVIRSSAGYFERITSLYDSRDLLEGEIIDNEVSIKAFISSPGSFKKTRSDQHLFVNRRPIEYKYLNYTLKRAYEGFLSDGYPQCFFYISINPSLIDVNIHPAKKEIKFFDAKYIDSMIYSAAKKILGTRIYSISNFQKESSLISNATIISSGTERVNSGVETNKNHYAAEKQISSDSYLAVSEEQKSLSHISASCDYSVKSVVFGKYLLIEKSGLLYYVDFHAAHERMLYDAVLAKTSSADSLPLVFPETIKLPKVKF